MSEIMNFFQTSQIWATCDALITLFTVVITLCTVVGVGLNFRNNKKQLEKVPIFFNHRKLNLDIIRKNISRAELQGILGIFRKDMNKNYDIEYLSTIEFLDSIYRVQKSKEDKLIIKLQEDELNQFKDEIFE